MLGLLLLRVLVIAIALLLVAVSPLSRLRQGRRAGSTPQLTLACYLRRVEEREEEEEKEEEKEKKEENK